MCLDEHEMLETGQLTLYKAAEMLINLLARAEAAEAERDDCADQIANLLPRVNREAVEQRKRAEAAEARVAELEESVVLGAAARDILAERARQISAEGWIPKHDDAHDKGEIASAAAAYAAASTFYHADPYAAVLSIWPWKRAWLKPTNPRRDLVKAGALILAEIERLDRAAALKGSTT
jgi:vacuolar-type H+-ATPase subunit I/STV1